VLVLGAGTIGLMAVVAARAGGAGEILVTARRRSRRPRRRRSAPTACSTTPKRPELYAAAAESPIDVVIESVGGAANTLDVAVRASRPGGTICLLGVYTKPFPFPR
jgi:threonine dehydrogenase-like Zn-dependent dehydrogenase